MESDWQRRGHPLHDSSPSAALPTLPSVAELLASSSRSTTDPVPAYHHQPSNSLRPPSRSTPPAPVPTVNTTNSSEHPQFVAANLTGGPSPTESAISTASTERQHHQHSTAPPATFPFTPASTFEFSQAPQDAAHPPLPLSARRQDSAISQQPIETSSEGLTFAPSPESNYSYSHRSPNEACNSTSPRPATTANHQPHYSAPSWTSHEQVAIPSTRNITPSQAPEVMNNTNTRPQRYNVRFATTHTPDNMPSTQRSRQSPPLPTPPAMPEKVESPPAPQEVTTTPTIEPAILAITQSLQRTEEHPPFDARVRDPSVERCLECNETWSRPLPEKNHSANFVEIVASLRQHTGKADAQYEQWKEKHSHCKRNTQRASPLHDPHTIAPNSHVNGTGQGETSSNKRKSDLPHDDVPKLRRVTFEPHTTATPVRPSAPI